MEDICHLSREKWSWIQRQDEGKLKKELKKQTNKRRPVWLHKNTADCPCEVSDIHPAHTKQALFDIDSLRGEAVTSQRGKF